MTVVVTFLQRAHGGRAHPASDSPQYRPHLVVEGTRLDRARVDGQPSDEEHYIGVQFTGDGEPLTQGVEHVVELTLPYDVDSTALTPGATFTLREGPTVVGHGRVLER